MTSSTIFYRSAQTQGPGGWMQAPEGSGDSLCADPAYEVHECSCMEERDEAVERCVREGRELILQRDQARADALAATEALQQVAEALDGEQVLKELRRLLSEYYKRDNDFLATRLDYTVQAVEFALNRFVQPALTRAAKYAPEGEGGHDAH